MFTVKGFIIILCLAYVTKTIVYIIDKLLKFKDEKIQFTMDVKKESIMSMTGIEFEAFCRWLFEGTGEYKYVEITQARGDGGKDLILIDKNEEKTYVECKRFDSEEKLETIENKGDIKKLVIGREVCQNLVGAMISNNIDKG
ncbi:restriction endonuclease, partial [Clostridium sp.]|uniref:restriction endonuclease n=1 Tax=Clostridium sp. TaxID=1506 RepID=UPI003464B2D8